MTKHKSKKTEHLKGSFQRRKRKGLIKEIIFMLRFFREFIKGIYTFHHVYNCITVYGSARFNENNFYYQMAQKLGKELALSGFAVMTGAGPGIMEAANRGAQEVSDSLSVGCGIELPAEEQFNKYLDKSIKLRYFFARKVMLTKHSVGFVAMPGGFGTMDELFEITTLVQTERIKDFPIVLMGVDFWQPLLHYLEETFVSHETIGPSDISELFFLTDSVDEALIYIKNKIRYAEKHG